MWVVAASALGLIFIAELGDKTLLAVLLLSARYPPWPIFLGACSAFLVHTTLAVGFGQVFALLPAAWIRWSAVALFAVFGILLLARPPESEPTADAGGKRPFAAAFAFIFLAEWGDLTQIQTAALTAKATAALGRWPGSLAVFAGATGGLWLGTLLAVIVGRSSGRWLPARTVRAVAGVCFLVFAALTALGKGV